MHSRLKYFINHEKTLEHAEMLSNRVASRFRYLSKRFKRKNIDCFRLYDRDIPEVRAVVDWYAGHIVVAEYERMQTGPEWLQYMANAVGSVLNVPQAKIHMKRRHTRTPGKQRYQRIDTQGERIKVMERGLAFLVNLRDFIDTGLHSDHRDTRNIIRELSQDKDFLNLFAYTGTFTCAAASGGARSTVTVDKSGTYLNWAKDNMALNSLTGGQHEFIKSDAGIFLERAHREGRRFTLAFIDPPSFFTYGEKNIDFDINRDHSLLIRTVLRVMAPGSTLFFSTNHQRFEPRIEGIQVKDIVEMTPSTIPEDYRNRKVHRCWKITV
ncbi:MAG: class I SAM-dependent methyltransferase [Deltaproteobacteria bacterium]|nr:class I SAM-dependent methyltransferase [Deltaproteobacteria bacterium]